MDTTSEDTALRDALAKQVVEHFCKVLNTALVIDRHAISYLFQSRYACNKELSKVAVMNEDTPSTVSALGVLNGLVYSTGWRIQAVCSDIDPDGDILEFRPGFYPVS